MTDKLKETERAAFEAWARPSGFDLRRNEMLGHYASLDTTRAWEGWQARAALAQQDAQAVVQDHSDLYAQGWVNGTQVQSLIDWCNSGCAKRADIAFTGGPSRQIAYAIEHLVKRASNLETSEGVFVPRELLATVANALGLPYEAEHTRLRSKLLDILSFAAPAQRVMLTDEEIAVLRKRVIGLNMAVTPVDVEFAHAVIEAYERKNGKEAP